MPFDHTKQYRATIIRGKAKSDLDNLLPAYANIISEICPCTVGDFPQMFNERLLKFLTSSTKKTLDNHRTEIAGKLFGMYYADAEGIIQPSERTIAFLENHDQPFFFKDICFKFQFPNGMDSVPTLLEKIQHRISIRQFPFILKLLLIADRNATFITKDELAYYVLNALEVLQGSVSPEEVFSTIAGARQNKMSFKVEYPGKASSYSMQHINEQLNLLELANLVRIDSGNVYLNKMEADAINYIADSWNEAPGFDVYKFNLADPAQRKAMYFDWDLYYGKLAPEAAAKFVTKIEALEFQMQPVSIPVAGPVSGKTTVELGDEGEGYVYKIEKERVCNFDPRLANKVRLFGKTKGLGYDIQSVVAMPGENAEFARYLEVKSTKRVTPPDLSSNGLIDAVNFTRNEWVAAQQHKDSYSIYRVYFTSKGVSIFVINNPSKKIEEKKITLIATTFRLDFQSTAVDIKI